MNKIVIFVSAAESAADNLEATEKLIANFNALSVTHARVDLVVMA